MKRRTFIGLIGGTAAWPLAARGQQPAMPVVGVLSTRAPGDDPHVLAPFHEGLKELGFIEDKIWGSNIVSRQTKQPENKNSQLSAQLLDGSRRRNEGKSREINELPVLDSNVVTRCMSPVVALRVSLLRHRNSAAVGEVRTLTDRQFGPARSRMTRSRRSDAGLLPRKQAV